MRVRPDGDPWQGWKGFALALGAGVAIVFVWEMVDLVRFLSTLDGGMEEGAIWAMLLMIAATLGTLTVVGGGLFRAIRRQASAGRGPDGRAGRNGLEGHPPDPGRERA